MTVGVKDGVGVAVGLSVAVSVGARVGVLASAAVLVELGALTMGAGARVEVCPSDGPFEGPAQAERSKVSSTRKKTGCFWVIVLL